MPGPTEPMTHRGRSGVDQASADSRAIRAPAYAVSRMRSVMSYSARFAQLEPNVLVSTASQPTAKYASWTERTTSGRVMLRISLQPS